MNFRPFDYSDRDYQLYVELHNAVYPDRPLTAEEVGHMEATKGPEDLSSRFFVEQDEQTIGWLALMTPRSSPVAGRLQVEWGLVSGYGHLSEGVWGLLEQQIAPHQARELITQVREDWPQASFYASKGFEVFDKMWASQLDLEAFDPTPFQRPLPANIQVMTLADLDHLSETVQRQYYGLMVRLLRDVPFSQPLEIWPFELWQERVMKDNKLLPQANFIALDEAQMAGVSQLLKSNHPNTLQTGLTGVLQSHRRQGIAQHLKLRAAIYAKQHGYRHIRTSNHQINHQMLAINEAMGFVKEPAWVQLKKDLQL